MRVYISKLSEERSIRSIHFEIPIFLTGCKLVFWFQESDRRFFKRINHPNRNDWKYDFWGNIVK